MTRLIASELIQLRTIRTPMVIAGGWLLATTVIVALIGYVAPLDDLATLYDRESAPRQVGAGLGMLLLPVIGVGVATTDLRRRTIGAALLAEPRRERVWLAKAAAAIGIGATLGLATGLVSGAALRLAINLQGGGPPLEVDELVRTALVVSLLGALLVLFGLGIGGVVRNQTGAIVLALAFLLVVQNVLAILLALAGIEEAARWIPGALLPQIADWGLAEAEVFSDETDAFTPPVATLIFAAYGGILTLLSALRLRGADIS